MIRVFAGRRGDAVSLLEYALLQMYGLVKAPPVARTGRGKPWFPSARHIRFNLSHSGDLVLCAVGDGEVGVDIETVRPRRDNLPRFVLTQGEYETFLRGGGTWESFYTLWTRKEAWGKFTGKGIPGHPSRLSVPAHAHIRSYAGEGWRCAVCAGEPPPELEWVDEYTKRA